MQPGSGRGGVGAKGLLAKIRCDDDLLQASGLPQLEVILGTGIMGRRQAIPAPRWAAALASLESRGYGACSISASATLTEQMLELRSLRSKCFGDRCHACQRIEVRAAGVQASDQDPGRARRAL